MIIIRSILSFDGLRLSIGQWSRTYGSEINEYNLTFSRAIMIKRNIVIGIIVIV